MPKTRTGYLTTQWTDPEGTKHEVNDGVEFAYESDQDKVDYESLVHLGVITHTAKQAEKAVEAAEAEQAKEVQQIQSKDERSSTGPSKA